MIDERMPPSISTCNEIHPSLPFTTDIQANIKHRVCEKHRGKISGHLIWRRKYGVEGLTAEYISPEIETGKQLILGFDNNARPCQYLNPGLQNTVAGPQRQVQCLVYILERTTNLMVPGQALSINFKSKGRGFNTTAPITITNDN